MILAVADYAERRPGALPPLELRWLFECQDFPGTLPYPGSLWEQPAGLIHRMRYLGWVYSVMRGASKWRSIVAWKAADPEGYKLKQHIDKLRGVRTDRHDELSPMQSPRPRARRR